MLDDMRQVTLAEVSLELPGTHPTVVLQEVDPPHRELRFPIGYPEGVAIAYAWKQMASPRPLTHELFAEVLEELNVSLELVEITGVEGATYLAQLTFIAGGERKVVPSRPSDALALALRQKVPVPIMVREQLLVRM